MFEISVDCGEVKMRDPESGVTLRWMEDAPHTLITESMGTLRGVDFVNRSNEMTLFAVEQGFLKSDKSSILKQQTRERVGRLIREARTAAGLTTRQLSEMCGLSHSHIVRIESGRYAVTIDSIALIADALGKSITIE